jgi:hypothetical protein
MKIGLGIQNLIAGMHRQQGDLISQFLCFQNRESRLKLTTKTYQISFYKQNSDRAAIRLYE